MLFFVMLLALAALQLRVWRRPAEGAR